MKIAVAIFSMAVVMQANVRVIADSPKPTKEKPPVWRFDPDKPDDVLIWRTRVGDRPGALAVFGDRVLVGTNNFGLPDRTLLWSLSAKTGTPIWKIGHDRLPLRRNDQPGSPFSSRPCLDGNRLYYVSNRCELCCVDFGDGHRIWTIDMMKDLKVHKRDPGDAGVLISSVAVDGDLVFCITGNGAKENSQPQDVAQPDAPSFLAVDKMTGKIAWSSNAPGKNIIYGQWSTPAFAVIDGMHEVLFPGGDGFLYAFEQLTGNELWKVDCRDLRRSDFVDFIVAPPIVDGNVAYVTTNRDFESGAGLRHSVYCIDLRTARIKWTYRNPKFHGTFGPMVMDHDHLYIAECWGIILALDKQTGQLTWETDTRDDYYGGLFLDGSNLYAGGDVVFQIDSRTGAITKQFDVRATAPVTPVVVDHRLFIATDEYVWCLRLKE